MPSTVSARTDPPAVVGSESRRRDHPAALDDALADGLLSRSDGSPDPRTGEQFYELTPRGRARVFKPYRGE